ncbi:MAG: 50S ribosomal protein L11 methyltransferase [Pseudomonadota bacterium]
MTDRELPDWRTFIQNNTKPMAPPLVPEITLNLAEESLPIWRKTEEELGEINVPPPFWAFAWAGGQALARYVLDHPSVVANRNVLDLGSGSALVAIAAMRAGASRAVANDLDEIANIAAQLNAEQNGVDIVSEPSDVLDQDPTAYGAVLVGDLFYEEPLAARVLAFCKQADTAGVPVLIGDPNRNFCPTDQLERCTSYAVPVTRELEDSEIKSTSVWQLAHDTAAQAR